jgi:phosphohistidine phosphatase
MTAAKKPVPKPASPSSAGSNAAGIGKRPARARDASGRFVKTKGPAPALASVSDPREASMSMLPEPSEQLQLYLLRHADAGDPMAWPGDDAERPLSAKGRRQARRLGNLLADIGWKPDLILTSPMVRAADTARIIGRAVGVKPADEHSLGSGIGLGDVGTLLAAHPEAKRVVLVGHDPDFSAVASTLTGAAIELRKGAIARIDLQDASPAAGQGALRWLIPPGVVPD